MSLNAHGLQVLSVFAAAPDLVNMLRTVEMGYNAMLNQQPGWMESPFAEFLPFMSEQARDWEAAATADSNGAANQVRLVMQRTIWTC